MTPEDLKRIQKAETRRSQLKASIDRGAPDSQVLPALGQTAAAFAEAYGAMWKRLEGGEP